MKINFFSSDPRQKAREAMDQLMRQGTDQLAIATGFCSAAGVKILMSHTDLLAHPGSFVVVPVAPPTDYDELEKLHAKIPSNLFVHWGADSPYEMKTGSALMHSKVIYARSGNNCWLWTGSHNFTGNATQGSNCEAAIVLQGDASLPPFVSAIKHLERCREEAAAYDPDLSPPGKVRREDLLVLHAESDVDLEAFLPCRLHLCLDSSEYDELLRAPVSVRLHLYSVGSLARGWQAAEPKKAFSGLVTGVNFTGRNPNTARAGATAEWPADFNVDERDGVLALSRTAVAGRQVATQAVVSIHGIAPIYEPLFTERPRVIRELITGQERILPLDSDMRKFFRASDTRPEGLLLSPAIGRRQVVRVAIGDLRASDHAQVRSALTGRPDIPIETEEPREKHPSRRHPFIVRAKYRLSDGV